MPNRQYEAGRRFEYRVKQDLIRRGYHCRRTPGSKGLYDLAAQASKDTGPQPLAILFVQVKGGEKKVEHAKWNELFDLVKKYDALGLVADRDGRKIRYRLITGYHTYRSRDWPAESYEP